MDLFYRALFVFAFIYFLTRVMGKRELASMQPFDLILLVIVGDAMQQGLTQDDFSLTGGVIVISTIALLQVLVSYILVPVQAHAAAPGGRATIIVERGKLTGSSETCTARGAVVRSRILYAQLRANQVTSIDEVGRAVLETSGAITVIPKAADALPERSGRGLALRRPTRERSRSAAGEWRREQSRAGPGRLRAGGRPRGDRRVGRRAGLPGSRGTPRSRKARGSSSSSCPRPSSRR